MTKGRRRVLYKESTLLADAILGRWPDWKKFLRVVPKKQTVTKGCLSMRIPCENPAVYRGLRVGTFGAAIYVEFDHDILHINDYSDEDPNLIGLTLRILEGYVTDRLLVVSWWQKRSVRVSTSLEPGDPIEKPTMLLGATSCRIRSWSGKYDKDELYS